MIIGAVIDFTVGITLIVLGLLVWKKQKISILHEYHYKNVSREDIPAYARQIGMGLLTIGVGIVVTGILELVISSFWWIASAAGFVIGLILIFRAQKKFNGSVMG